ncbi:hypothetical protein H0I25_05530 [Cellulophaga sp. HaHa_2_95]|uniref:hypothetical protein n=1 Tax=Cellulophaga sp. HaHa_2_95 TaxID=2745558 RepID=UPI001C4F9715|nr:hypothetical protein [Cellulophaga sp. HaHa_2_95]QXP57250.1 hypothetical protein H0I25_05530 [Cellulophaga sp. HaHa_2_95]
MAKLQVQRISEWNNKARLIELYIDGTKQGDIANGKTLDLELTPGSYDVIAKINTRTSQKLTVTVKADETKTLRLSGFKYGSFVMPLIIGSVLIFLATKAFLQIELKFLLALSIMAFLYPVYYMTLGKNNYLSLTEANRTS